MPHEPARVADTRSWLAKADMGCTTADSDFTAVPPFTADVVFHAQQAAEKALKAFLAWHDIPFRKTHDLTEIGQQCVEIDPSLEPLLARAARLTAYAWKFRYPGDPADPSREEAETALGVAREVVAAVLQRVPSEVRP